MYQRGVAEDNSRLIATACGDVDRRRDNHRVFSREEEALLRSAIDQENIDPNTHDIQRLALRIHRQHEDELSSSLASNSSSRSTPSFSASMGFVERVRRDLHLSAQKPRFERKNKRIKGPEVEEKRELEAIEFIDDVHRPVYATEHGWSSMQMRRRASSSTFLTLYSLQWVANILPSSIPTIPTRRHSA